MKFSLFCFATAIFAMVSVNAAVMSANYKVCVTNMWTSANFGSVPSGAHLSPLVVASHANRFTPFILYGYATDGVKDVCEFGSTRDLRKEYDDAGALVNDYATGGGSFGVGPGGTFCATVATTVSHPYISFITMLAPSDDWIVGASRLSMLSKKGSSLKKKRSGNLFAYDCGTKENSRATVPRLNIAPVTEAPFNTGIPVASYTITRM